jgi:hypothetical protein
VLAVAAVLLLESLEELQTFLAVLEVQAVAVQVEVTQ